MAALRKGDVVQLKAVVTSVAPYDGGQQIMAKLLPNGSEIGWLLQRETAFTIVEQPVAKGDVVRFKNDADGVHYELLHFFEHNQIAVREVGGKNVQITSPNRVERVR